MKKDEAVKLIEQAREHFYNNLYDSAAALYLKAYTLDKDSFDSQDFSDMGNSYYEIDNFATAAIYLEKAIEIETNTGGLLLLYAQIADTYERAKNYQKAIDNLEKMAELYIDDSHFKGAELEAGFENLFLGTTYFKIAGLYFIEGRKEEGLDYLGRAIDFGHNGAKEEFKEKTNQDYVSAKEQTQALIKKATRYYIDDNYELAAKTFKEAFIIIPEVFESFDLFAMGISCYYTKDYRMAKSCLEGTMVLETNKNRQFYACFFLSHIYKKQHDKEMATALMANPFSLANNHFDKSIAYFEHGRVEDTMGNPRKAIDSFHKSIDHLLQHLSHTEADVMAGKVKYDTLGKIYFNIAITLYKFKNKDWEKIDSYMQKAALCGYKTGVELKVNSEQ